jgi:hypothetical protein
LLLARARQNDNQMIRSIRYTPFYSFIKTLQYLLTGRLHFLKDQIGAVFSNERGQRFTVFRHMVVDPDQSQPSRVGAVFIAQFRVAGMSVRLNILFSWLPIPFYIGLPGFRSKRWMVDEERGVFAGYYKWDTQEMAENYAGSYAAKFMTARSVPGTVNFQVYPRERAPAPPSK